MLEEVLKDEKRNPAEVATAMLSFVHNELGPGGTSAENRFFRLYEPLCERIFGPMLGAKDAYRHKEGGWLSASTPWTNPNAMTRSNNNSNSSSAHLSGHGVVVPRSVSLESDPVVKLLGTSGKASSSSSSSRISQEAFLPTLLEVISKESANQPGLWFPMPFEALPKSTRDAWKFLLEQSMVGVVGPITSSQQSLLCSRSTARLLDGVLQRPPAQQLELLSHLQTMLFTHNHNNKNKDAHSPTLTPRGFASSFASPLRTAQQQTSSSARWDGTTATPHQPSASSSSMNDISPRVRLGMLEHYLFLFLRYPLAAPQMTAAAPAVRGGTATTPYRSHRSSLPLRGGKREAHGETIYVHLFGRYMRHFLPYQREEQRHILINENNTRNSELFARAIVALWVETQGRIKPTQVLLERQPTVATWDLHRSYDFVQASYDPPVAMLVRCLRALIVHAVLDPALHAGNTGTNSFRLTPLMAILQEAIYNYIRITFRYASLHASGSPFYGALDIWLIWLEPWNVQNAKSRQFSTTNATQHILGSVGRGGGGSGLSRRVLTFPKHHETSRYQASWETYIASNVYLFSVPLAIFLRRSRELDFSGQKFHRSMLLVRRVFRVFSPQVVDVMSRHLNEAASPAVRSHVEILGPHAPPPGPLSLSSCQDDMKFLLEEISMQHVKNVRGMDIFDRFAAYMEGLFGQGVVAGQEKALQQLVERARLMVALPADYTVLATPRAGEGEQTTGAAKVPAMYTNGKLTDVGFRRVLDGEVKFNPADIEFSAENKLRPMAGPHDVTLLVELAYWASGWVEKKTGVRLQLQFLADYRNLLFFGLLGYAVRFVVAIIW